MLSGTTAHLWWYVSRSAGIVAWALATASVAWGLLLSTRLGGRKLRSASLLDLHRFLGTLTLVAVGVHLVSLWADSYTHFAARDLLVPMASSWRPGAVAFGVVALYALVAIQATSWAMQRLPKRLWHAVHLSSVVVFVGSTIHFVKAGSDADVPALQWLMVLGVALVAFLTIVRVLSPRATARRAPARAGMTAR